MYRINRLACAGLSHLRPPPSASAPFRNPIRRNTTTTPHFNSNPPPPSSLLSPTPPAATPQTPKPAPKRRILSVLLNTVKLYFFLHLIASHVVMISPCAGASMLPTFPAEMHWVLVSRLHKLGRHVQVGDVVSLRHPMFPGTLAAKRLVGMPGDYVVVDPLEKEPVMLQVPPGHCYVMGDNLTHSRDSRHYGPVPLGLLEGKVVARLSWPMEILRRPFEKV